MLLSISVFCLGGVVLFRFIQPPVKSSANREVSSMKLIKKVNQNA